MTVRNPHPAASRLVHNAAAAMTQIVAAAAVLFLLYRFLLRELGAEALGTWALLTALVSVARVGEVGLPGSMVRFVASLRAAGRAPEARRLTRVATGAVAVSLAAVLAAAYLPLDWALGRLMPAGPAAAAREVLPLAAAVVWVGGIGAVLTGALDGQSRIGARAAIVVAGALVLFGTALVLVPRLGLTGLVLGQLAQAGAIVLLAVAALRAGAAPSIAAGAAAAGSLVPETGRSLRADLRLLAGYGAPVQFITLVGLALDPLTKAILGTVAGLAVVAYWELAFRLVGQFRMLVLAANQAVVPYVAGLGESAPARVRSLYRASVKVVLFAAVPGLCGLAAVAPVIGTVWIGHPEPLFVAFCVILAGANAINALCGPAYFSNLGEGDLRANVAAHAVMAAANAVLSLAAGAAFGAIGVAAGYGAAIALGSLMVTHAFHRRTGLRLGDVFTREDLALAASGAAGALAALALSGAVAGRWPVWLVAAAAGALFAAVVAPAMWRHSGGRQLAARLLAAAAGQPAR
jgi:O-antigen/teichoic acid export membrane protein